MMPRNTESHPCAQSISKEHHEHHHENACSSGEHDGHNHESGCGCGNVTGDRGHMRRDLLRCGLAALLFALALLFAPEETLPRVLWFLPPYLLVGTDVLYGALRGLFRGKLLNEQFLMSLATIGALLLGEAPEAVAVMLLYQVGELLGHAAERRSRRSIRGLLSLRPENARVLREGESRLVTPEQVQPGETLLVHPGERVALDGVVIDGTARIDSSALTGESLPRTVEAGEEVLAGCLCLDTVLSLRVLRPAGESAVARILRMTEEAAGNKASRERFITRFARFYTPVVVLLALLLALLPPLFAEQAFDSWLYRALCFLVISCPCALVISVPLGFFGGIGGAARQGVLFKGGNTLEAMANTEIVVFDKTGTLTEGKLTVSELCPAQGSAEDLLRLAARAERQSGHPVARAFREAWNGGEDSGEGVRLLREQAGMGIMAEVDGATVLVGSAAWLRTSGCAVPEEQTEGLSIYIACDGVYQGVIRLGDRLRDGAREAIEELRCLGVGKTVVLSGDTEKAALAVSARLCIDETHAALLPEGKLGHLEALLHREKPRGSLIFVGDGINDAPALTRADVGVAMGALGQDAAIEAADLVLGDDDLRKIGKAIRIARKTRAVVTQNIVFALSAKLLFLVLGALGIADMWTAVFADVGVTLLAILNALRCLGKKV